ncbi:MAG TPA: aminoglycoside phosphotransferase family protein [Pseudonocardiaceae bacterium]
MLDEPELDIATVAAYVRQGWGLDVTLRFLPIGYDAAAWAYEATAAGERYFVKLRRGAPGPGPAVARYLRDGGLAAVLAPLPTRAGPPYHQAGGWSLLLHPFVDGDDAWRDGLTDEQWTEFGAFLGALHATPPPPGVALPRETYEAPAVAFVRAHEPEPAEGVRAEFAAAWRSHLDATLALADRVERLGRAAAAAAPPPVLCHADAHGANLMIEPSGRLHVVDWDEVVLAPRERDLLFVLGPAFGERPPTPAQLDRFRRGYGALDADPVVLGFLRDRRVLDDIAEFARGVARPDASEESRRGDLRWFRRQFG